MPACPAVGTIGPVGLAALLHRSWSMAFSYFRMPVGPWTLLRRTVNEIIKDDCLGLAAQLAFYFLLSLFPALVFLVALIGVLPVSGLLQERIGGLSGFVPPDVIEMIRSEISRLAQGDSAGLLTFGILGALWSSSTGMLAIINTVNAAYDLPETRAWWRTRLVAIGLTLSLAVFMIVAQGLLQLGPWALSELAARAGLDLGWAGTALKWTLAIAALTLAVDLIYHYAPAARSEFTWLTPGAVVAVGLWVAASMVFRYYVMAVSDFSTTYGTLGGVIVVMFWFYLSGLAVLIGAELNSEIDRASAEIHRGVGRVDADARGDRAVGVAGERSGATSSPQV